MSPVADRLRAAAAYQDSLVARFQYRGGRDPNTQAAARHSAERQGCHRQFATDLRAGAAALEADISFATADAPVNTNLLGYGGVGWRFMRRRASGQWENMMGHPLPPPKAWRPMPSAPRHIVARPR